MKFIDYSNSNYKDEVLNVINSRQKEIFDFFNSDVIELPCTVYIYDSIESLIEGLKKEAFLKIRIICVLVLRILIIL